jgi:hypothetical protein
MKTTTKIWAWITAAAALAWGAAGTLNHFHGKAHDRIMHTMNDVGEKVGNAESSPKLLAIRTKFALIQGLLRDQETYRNFIELWDFIPDNHSIEWLLDEVARWISEENIDDEKLTEIDKKIQQIIETLWAELQADKKEIMERIQTGKEYISDKEIREIQWYVSECLNLMDTQLTPSGGPSIDYLKTGDVEMLEFLRNFAQWGASKEALEKIIDHYLSQHANNPQSSLTLHHLAEIGSRLEAGDSIGELIVKYGIIAVILSMLVITLIVVWKVYAVTAPVIKWARTAKKTWDTGMVQKLWASLLETLRKIFRKKVATPPRLPSSSPAPTTPDEHTWPTPWEPGSAPLVDTDVLPPESRP